MSSPVSENIWLLARATVPPLWGCRQPARARQQLGEGGQGVGVEADSRGRGEQEQTAGSAGR